MHRPESKVADGFLSSKRDKRLIRRSAFVSKIHKDHKKPLKRRRPSKKLVATLESLADALPELDPEADGDAAQLRAGKVRHRSLKSKPGALKKKERIVKGEMERFGFSLARLAAVPEAPTVTETPAKVKARANGGKKAGTGTAVKDGQQEAQPAARSTSNRWAALRGYISSTMEQNPAFTGDGKS